MNRTEIINNLISKNNFKSYLEIGLDNPENNYIHISCETKHSVDPFFEKDHKNGCDLGIENFEKAFKYLTYRMTSDEFFSQCDRNYDIIFIDGLHIQEQCGRDIINSLKHLNPGGYIIVHDCIPESEETQCVPRTHYGTWNGDVWKCMPELEKQNIEYNVVDCDYGCGIINYKENSENLHYLEKSKYKWNDFIENKEKLMHLISEEDFLKRYILN